jgi:DNA-binding PadR family transcriptional regulator
MAPQAIPTHDDDRTADAETAARDVWMQLSAFQRDLVAAIASFDGDEEPPHGLEIKHILSAAYGEEVNHGRLYPNLDTLVEGDVVRKSERVRDDRTNDYELTTWGERVLQAGADRLAEATGAGE